MSANNSSAGPLRAKAGHNTRQEILDAAAEVFTEVGFKAASVKAIAEKVGIKAPSLYTHFKSKNQILYTVLSEGARSLRADCTEAVSSAGDDPRLQMERFVRANLEPIVERRGTVPMFDSYLYQAPGSASFRVLTRQQISVLNKVQRDIVDVVKNIIIVGLNKNIMSVRDITVATFGVLGIIEHVAYWYSPSGRLSIEQIIEEITHLCLSSLNCISE